MNGGGEMKLTAENVHTVFMGCLFGEGEDHTNYVAVHGVTINVGFHPQRLENRREDVRSMLADLPAEFKEGWSFLNACMDKHGNQWGEHHTIDELVTLGIGLKLVSFSMPERELWKILPGGVPYISVHL